MGGTEKVLRKIPENVRLHIEWMKKQYKEERYSEVIRKCAASYILALRDAGLISELERRLLFNYTTL